MPDDIRPLTATDWEKVFEVKFLELGDGGTVDDRRKLLIQVIASAMAAERNRCAKIVESHELLLDGHKRGLVREITAAMARREKTDLYFGKDCPKGMVQVEFVSVDPALRYSDYGWKPSAKASVDIYVDGQRFLIQIGDFDSGHGGVRGLHVFFPPGTKLDRHSVNTIDLCVPTEEGPDNAG